MSGSGRWRSAVARRSIACVALLSLAAGGARAGGLYISEFGTTLMGTASAGAQAYADDASTAFHNPAGMARLDSHALMAGAGVLASDIRFDQDPATPVAGGNGGQQGSFAPILSNSYVHSLTDRFKLGISLISVSGAVLEPDNSWAGRFQLQEVTLLTLTATPSLAVRLTDWLSLGAGANLMYARMSYKLAVPLLPLGQVKLNQLDDFEPGFTVGALAELGPRTRFGALYTSKIEPDLSGDIRLGGFTGAVDTKIPLVQTVRTSLYHGLDDRWALLGSAGWENWSDFGTQWVNTAGGAAPVPRNWKDTWYVAAGVHYRPQPRWLLQTGFKYDSSPVSSSNRTADMPMDQQFRAAVGAQYRWSERLTLGASFVYANYGEGQINQTGANGLIGDYSSNNLFFFSLTIGYKWSPPGAEAALFQ